MSHRYRVTCKVCGNEVIKSNKQETCSVACARRLLTQRRKERAQVAECPCCKVVAPLEWRVRDVQVCSKRCSYVLNARFFRQKDDWHHAKYKQLHARAAEGTCVCCGAVFIPRRYDQRFCTTRCGDNWSLRYGKKGENRRRKVDEAREQRNREAGACALCGTPHTRIIPPGLLGLRSKGAKAKFHSDHIVPRFNGGHDGDDNRRYVCWFCNVARQNLDAQFDPAISAAGKAFWAAIAPLYTSMTSQG